MQAFLTRHYRSIFPICILAIAGLAFYVGMLEGKGQGNSAVSLNCSDTTLASLRIPTQERSQDKPAAASTVLGASTAPQGAFAGSKNGTKYYAPDCPALGRINPENIVWFPTVEDATLQGYTPGSC